MKIKRRIYDREKKSTKEKIETATLVKKGKKTVLVKLKNGDIIKRKMRDIIEWDKKKGKK